MAALPLTIPLLLFLATPIREEILARAESWAELTWYADSANTVVWDSMFTCYGCSEHLTSDWEAGLTYQGMAYSYGGNDDTVSYLDKLADSLAAGNHMCHYNNYGAETGIYPPDWTTGIDCSAFVCRVWGIPRTNVTGIYNRYHHLEKSDVQPGDALAWPGHHIVLIVDPGPDPPYGALSIFEASGSACRVWYNPAASWSAYASYRAVSWFKQDKPDTAADTLSDDFEFDPMSRGSVVFSFPQADDRLELVIFNSAGQRVYTRDIDPDERDFTWFGVDDLGNLLPSGVYYVALEASQVHYFGRLIFLK